jgi:hypothetical protein
MIQSSNNNTTNTQTAFDRNTLQQPQHSSSYYVGPYKLEKTLGKGQTGE